MLGFILAACQGAVPASQAPTTAAPTSAAIQPPALATPPPTDPPPRLSGLIVFQRTGHGIFTVDPNGDGERQLLPGEYQNPRWSPNGAVLALSHIVDDEHGVVVPAIANPDGSGARDLPLRQKGLHCGAPVWSPDAIWLAAECWDEGDEAKTGIYLLRAADGRGLRQLTVGPSVPGGFSSDGRRLVFRHDDGRLAIVGADGAGERLIGATSVGLYPGFMPGDASVFASIDGMIAIVDLYGNVLRRVLAPEPKMYEPRLGLDGTTFVFTYDPSAVPAPGLARIQSDGVGFADILLASAGDGEDVGADWRP
jgi:hypothetical protein